MKELHFARFPVIDAFKAVASQLIVLHHLAAYGPVSVAAQQAAPAMIDWLYDYARMAVQVFFVIGGYLAARSMASNAGNISWLAVGLVNRYLRLVVPFLFSLVLAILCAIAASEFLTHDFIPKPPELEQFLAHAFLLHGVLDVDALSAGVWFVAVDFQLFALMLMIAWLGSKTADPGKIMLAVVTLLAAASLFWFNRDAGYDDWALYFFGAYGMGAVACWAGQRDYLARWFVLNIAIAIAALVVEFRLRILIAVCTALILFFTRNVRSLGGSKLQDSLHYLGTISYALFLVHFSVLMLMNAVFSWLELSSPIAGCVFMVLSWLASVISADFFYRRIELPLGQVLKLRHGKC